MKRPTQVDVAKRAGVSRSTVSYVINGNTDTMLAISKETRQRVLDAVAELGYVPDARAQSFRSGNTYTIGLIIPDVRNPHFWEYAETIEQEVRASGYNLLLSNTALNDNYAEDIFRDLSHRRIDGLIMVGAFISQSEEAIKILKTLLKRRLPIVEMTDHNVDYDVDLVTSDYREATKEVMTHLLSLQHRRIGFIHGAATPELIVDRLEPYQECLRSAGLLVENELIAKCGPTIEDGYQAAMQLLQRPQRPTALVAINDLLAIGAMRAAWNLGLNVPADLSLVGFDDIHMAKYLVPPLTTAARDTAAGGKEAVRQLLRRIADPSLPRQKARFPSRLIIRESTGPATG
ncbi:MAG: LacI family DNA-binding transcriptional regulator [Candidatus Promineifilaceae bacterium]|nr:LacI family DNA-binding transcriptional regulator [Candidatus Promineifilaceae bacterium]